MELNWSLLLDVLMIAMMAGTMAYAFTLNRNLEKLRGVKTEFDTTVQKLTLSIAQAEKGLQDMKLTAQEVGGGLEENIAAARGLSQELQFMIESADSLANRLSRAAESGGAARSEVRPENKPADLPMPAKTKANANAPTGLFGSRPVQSEPAPKTRSRAESQLLEDLGRVAAARVEQAKG